METKSQSHCWWFDSYNSSKCSPWLESTLTELNEKTKTMLKLIEEDADSFAQRAEMYYKKRPELISMVEDFYRAHRSLAERYDLLKSDRVVRVKSPLSHSLSLPNEECEYVLESMNSVKSFDSFTEATYSYEEVAESEVDDPELEEDGAQIEQGEEEVVKSGGECGVSYDELMMLREKLDELREENEIQTKIIRRMEEKEELVRRLSDNIGDLKELRGDMVWDDGLGVVVKENNELLLSFDEVTKLKDEIENFKVEMMYQKEEFKKKVEEVSYVRKKFEDEQTKNRYLENQIVKLREEMRRANEKGGDEEKQEAIRHLKDELTGKGMEKIKAIVQQKDKIVEKFQDRSKGNRELLDACICEDEKKQEVIRHLKDALTGKGMEKIEANDEIVEKLQERSEGNRELMDARICEDEEKKEAITKKDTEKIEAIVQVRESTEKNEEKSDAIKQLMEELAEKDMEIRQVSVAMENKMMNALAEKDEEKREAIRQLSAAMEILREESKFLKKSLVSISPKKSTRPDFHMFKAVDFGKLFKFTSSNQTSIVAL
ncbi:unnamed protein product [Amaranthus hypochondriacus]